MSFDVYKQNIIMFSNKYTKERSYWNEKISNSGEPAFIYTNSDTNTIKKEFSINGETFKLIKNMCNNSPVACYTMFVSVFQYVISRYTGKEKIYILSPILKNNAKIKEINDCVILNGVLNAESSFMELLKNISKEISISNELSNFPLIKTIEDFTLEKGNISLDKYIVSCKNIHEEIKRNDFQLVLEVDITEKEILLELSYRETIGTSNILHHIINVINEIVSNPNVKLKDIKMLSPQEENLLENFNNTEKYYPIDKTIEELFEEQVEKKPNKVALIFENQKLTYKILDKKSNSLARVLRDKGVNPNTIVGIISERSPEMIIGILGILKAGGVYLPIDPSYPKERIEYMLEDSKSNILLTMKDLICDVEFHGEIIDLFDKKLFELDSSKLENINTPDDLIYIIYTSGTTGKPKGTMVKRGSFNNLIKWYSSEFEMSKKDNVLLMSSVGFDLSQKNIYAPLIVGGKLTLANKGIINYDEINRIINEEKITIINCAPSAFNPIIDLNKDTSYEGLKSLRYVFLGGEVININQLNEWRDSGNYNAEIINTYGPTECTDIATFYRIKNEKYNSVPIGKPINNVKIYILNENKRFLPIGVVGELYISGDGISRGYLNKKSLTIEKFVDNPFEAGKKMYRTGDLARWMPNGEIEYIGRMDNQVKIRGFRIELGEIENKLLQHEDVREATVVIKKNKDDNMYICAYVVCNKDTKELNLQNYLKRSLPDYMIPTFFVCLHKMPITVNGKIDKRALPEPDFNNNLSKYEAPRNKTEGILVKIWREIFSGIKIGINDDFFQIGGNSLKATVLVSKIHKELSVKISIREIFKYPTISGISEYIEKTEKSIYKNIQKVEERNYYEASSAQKRMYMLQHFNLKSIVYNMPVVIEVKGKLKIEKLEETFKKLIQRHESLRTSFGTIEEQIVQIVNREVQFSVEYIKHEGKILDKNRMIKEFIRPFDLSQPSLLRVRVIKLEEEKHILLYDMHHIISDGISMRILINELISIYDGKELDDLKIQYKDYAEWQNNFLRLGQIKKQERYWIDRFSNEIPILNMPIDFARPSVQSFVGNSVNSVIDVELAKELNKVAKKAGCTMHMLLLSGINILLSKYTGQEDIIVGTPIAGRSHADFEKIIGMFVNTLAMRNYPIGEKTYKEFLNEVKENALKAYENQDYQFDELVDKLSINRDMSRNPLFDVMFIMEDIHGKDIEIRDLTLKECNQENKVSKFDLTFMVREIDGELLVNLEYCTALFKKETMSGMLEHFKNILKVISVDINVNLCEIEMITKCEKSKLLYEFNDTFVDHKKDKTITQLFEEQVEKIPNNIALVYGDKKLNYREVNEKANTLAWKLRNKGIKEEELVGIMVERSLEMIIGILAILKTGAAYVPIDPKYPSERINYILKDSKCSMCLSRKELAEKIEVNIKIVDLDDQASYSKNVCNLNLLNKETNLAYVIYTSGTTGNPKGVMIEHRSVLNTLLCLERKYKLASEDAYLLKTNYCFDVSVSEIFGWFIGSGKLVILKPDYEKEPDKILDEIIKNGVSHINFTSSMFNIFMNYLSEKNIKSLGKLKYILTAGEALKISDITFVNKLLKSIKVENLYGPTEASIYATIYSVDNIDGSTISIGKPVDNGKIYILDKYRNLLPVGIKGELYISGKGLGRGYLNRKDLTKEKFIDNRFELGTKMYKTGDLARWLPDGNIEYLGRIDYQVKIRGFRVELGEIEENLLNNDQIKEAVVIDRTDKTGSKYLCAYLVTNSNLTVKDLRENLSKKIPDYMIPSFFIYLKKLPLTSNGKIDRKALPEPYDNINIGSKYKAPRNEIEQKLVEIWKEVLAVKRIGINDNFFELGGNSIKSIILASRVNKLFNINFSIADIFNNQCISDLSNCISKKNFNYINKYEKVKLLKDSNSSNNLFFIHDGSGQIASYIALVNRLDNNYTYLGIDAEELLTGIPINTSIEELAKEYLGYMKFFQKEGPYFIAGWSLGGTLAFEICRQLEEKGETVKKLILIDSYISQMNSRSSFKVKDEVTYLSNLTNIKVSNNFKSIEKLYEAYEEIIMDIKIDDIFKKFSYNETYKLIADWNNYNGFELLKKINLIRTLIRANDNYYPKSKVKCSIDFIKAIDSTKSDHRIWESVITGRIRYRKVRGNHFSIFNEEIEYLASEIQNILK